MARKCRDVLICGLIAAGAGVVAAPAGAATRLASGDAGVHALTVDGGSAVAVVDSGDPASPFALVRSRGRSRVALGDYGGWDAEFADVAGGDSGRVVAAWARPISGGSAIEAITVTPGEREPYGAPMHFGSATGPPRIAATADGFVLAVPDRDGNIVLVERTLGDSGSESDERSRTLTTTGPARRHLPLDVAVGRSGGLVLDLIQTRTRTELRIVGDGAPAHPVVALRGLSAVPAVLAADGRRVAAAYISRGRAVLATERAGGGWRRHRLPGSGGARSAPALMLAGSEAIVVYEQHVRSAGSRRRYRQLFIARLRGGRLRTSRLARSRADDTAPFAASGTAGEMYVAWTRTRRGSRARTALLKRL